MVHLSCKCLNIQIHGKELKLVPLSTALQNQVTQNGSASVDTNPSLSSSSSATMANLINSLASIDSSSDAFFNPNNLSLITLALGGISKEHESLVQTRKAAGNWFVNRCLICNLEIHATYGREPSNSVLVSFGMIGDENQIKELHNSERYSSVFKVVLPHEPEHPHLVNRRPSVSSLAASNSSQITFGSSNPVIEAIQQSVSQYLQDEQAQMMARIRKYQAEEHERYGQLQMKVSKDKEVMLRLMNSLDLDHDSVSQENGSIDEKLDDISNGDSTILLSDMDDSVFRQPPVVMKRPSPGVLPSRNSKGRRGSNDDRIRSTTPDLTNSMPTGGIFPMENDIEDIDEHLGSQEGDDLENRTHSDDDDEEGEDGEGIWVRNIKNGRVTQPRAAPTPLRNVNDNAAKVYAVSMPVNIAGDKIVPRGSLAPVSDDEDELKDYTGSVADKMKLVARSYLYDRYSESIFGDLPSRPRM